MKDLAIKREFCLKLQNRFEVLADMQDQVEETGIEDMWQLVRNAYIETGSEVLAYSVYIYANKSRKEWISADTWKLADEWKEIRMQMMNNACHTSAEVLQQQYMDKNKAVKRSARRDKRNLLEEKAEEAAKLNDSRKLYNIIKRLVGKTQQTSTQIKDDNTLYAIHD